MALTTEEKTKLDKLSFINGGSHSGVYVGLQ